MRKSCLPVERTYGAAVPNLKKKNREKNKNKKMLVA